METMESTSWENDETPLHFISRHQPEGLAALVVDESESCSLKVGSQLFVPLQHLFSNSHLTIDPWYQRLWKSITRIFRFGEKETFTHVDMIECMDGKPLSDKSIQDCLSNNQPSLPEKNLPWPIEEDEESVKDSIDGESAKEEPESVLETCT
ncbi:hypothetical protein TNCV_339781 [Trichonephila clavipes]|nr:hypothetical protein TNCV_339781 [Trichonephila clavipes]